MTTKIIRICLDESCGHTYHWNMKHSHDAFHEEVECSECKSSDGKKHTVWDLFYHGNIFAIVTEFACNECKEKTRISEGLAMDRVTTEKIDETSYNLIYTEEETHDD